MKTKNLSPVGSLHPILFFAVVYIVALVLSIFICSSLFYSLYGNKTSAIEIEQSIEPFAEAPRPATSVTVAMR